MFSEKYSKKTDRIETLIGEQCSIVGNLNGDGILKIDGSVNGDIFWEDTIILGPTGIYCGNITCKDAFISGKVKGNIICEGALTIDFQGRICGDITVKNLVVAEGGVLDGKCTMIIALDASEILDT